MSAWLVSNQTISRIAKALPVADKESVKGLAESLYGMNVEALEEKYGEGNIGMIYGFHFFEKTTFPNIFQCYQSIKCFLYQCSEGKVPESNLFKRVEEYRKVVAESIADEATEKGGAVWG